MNHLSWIINTQVIIEAHKIRLCPIGQFLIPEILCTSLGTILSFLLNLLGWHQLTKLYRFQVHNSSTHHLYTGLCVHHPKHPSPFISPYPPPPPCTSSTSLQPLPSAITTLLFVSMSFFLFFSFLLNLSTSFHHPLDSCHRHLIFLKNNFGAKGVGNYYYY